MKCEDYLKRAETGNVVHRLLARWHAARCPRCAAAQRSLNRIKRDLADVEPLSPAHRRLWEQAADADVLRPAFSSLRFAVLTGVAALVLCAVVAAVWMLKFRTGNQEPEIAPRQAPPVPQGAVARAVDEDSLRQLERMKSGLSSLSDELDQLARRASLLDERKDVDQLLSEYHPL